MARRVESKRALSVVLVAINALVMLPILDNLGIGVYNAILITILSIGVFLYDSRKGNLNNSFLSSLVFLATALTLDNTYNAVYTMFPLYLKVVGVLLVAMLFFLTPVVVRFFLELFKNHPIILLVIGRIIAVTAAIGAVLFVYLKLGFVLKIGALSVTMAKGWSFWQIFVLLWIVIHLYQMWRNKRDITANHRFLYNAVALYLLSLIIYIGYIRDCITFG